MKGTLFQNVLNLYTLKMPTRKPIGKKIIQKIEYLALAFYTHFFNQTLKTSIPNGLLAKCGPPKQTIRQAYTNMFYSLGMGPNNQNKLDFIACLICLLGDTMLNNQKVQEDKKIQELLTTLAQKNQKVREYFFIQYTLQTLGLKVGKQSANILFQKIIICENNHQTNLGTKMRVNMQIKQFQQKLEQSSDAVYIRHRMRKGKQRSFQEEVKNIMEQNRIQLQQQKVNNKKFHKFLDKCITEGAIDMNNDLAKKSLRMIKVSTFLRTIKNFETLIKKSSNNSRKNKAQQQKNYNYKHWAEIVAQMKNLSFMSKKQRIEALACNRYSHQLSNLTQQPLSPTKQPRFLTKKPSQQKFHTQRQRQAQHQHQHQRQGQQKQRTIKCKKTLIQANNMLPDIKQYNNNRIILSQLQEQPQPVKKMNSNSRILKKQLSRFITERRVNRIL